MYIVRATYSRDALNMKSLTVLESANYCLCPQNWLKQNSRFKHKNWEIVNLGTSADVVIKRYTVDFGYNKLNGTLK
jgi:hypothetical protein